MNEVWFRMEKELNGRSRHNVSGVASHLEKHTWPEDKIELYYHWTPVVTARPDGSIVLRTNGYHTMTTKERMNRYLNIVRWQVIQHNYDWYVVSPDGDVYDYENGMVIYPDENKMLYEDRSVTISEQAKKLSKKWKASRARYQAYNQEMHVQPIVEPKPEREPIHVEAKWVMDTFVREVEKVAAQYEALLDRGEGQDEHKS